MKKNIGLKVFAIFLALCILCGFVFIINYIINNDKIDVLSRREQINELMFVICLIGGIIIWVFSTIAKRKYKNNDK